MQIQHNKFTFLFHEYIKYYYPFNINWKNIFCFAFYFKWKYFVLTTSYQKPFVFSVSVFCSQNLPKSNLRPNIGLTYAISIVKWFFKIFCLKKYFLLFFVVFEVLMFHNNTVKFSEKMNYCNLLKFCFQVTYPTDFCIIYIIFYYGKKWKYLFF